jgi:hypothetical protein
LNESRHNPVVIWAATGRDGVAGAPAREAACRPEEWTLNDQGGIPMLRSLPTSCPARPSPRSLAGLAAVAIAAALLPLPAQAQSASCQELGTHLTERKSLVESIQKLGGGKGKPIDAKAACTAFGKLVANGTTTLKWAESNKDWCQIPDQFVEGIKTDHEKVSKIRGQACTAAAKQAEMQKNAAGGGGPQGLLGGNGLEGSFKIPQGAL